MSASTAIDTGTPWLHRGTVAFPRVRFARKRSGIVTGIVHSQKGELRRADGQAPLVGQVLWQGDGWAVTSVGLSDNRGFVICAEDLVGLTDTGLLTWAIVQASFVPDWSGFWSAYLTALKIHHRMPRDRHDMALIQRTHAAAIKPIPKLATT
jgi:hypothetical protein